MFYNGEFNSFVLYLSSGVTFLLFVYLCTIEQPNKPADTFICPLIPLIPCLGIAGNFFLCTGIDYYTWLYLIFFEILGISFYFGYGMQNSKLNAHYERKEKRIKKVVDAQIANAL
jgi:hypothetical protein